MIYIISHELHNDTIVSPDMPEHLTYLIHHVTMGVQGVTNLKHGQQIVALKR